MSIKWDDTHNFTREGSLSNWDPPNRAAVYVIAYRKDPKGESDTYSAIYVGESGNLDDRGFSNHHKKQCWLDHVNDNEGRLAVYLHLMPNSTVDERRKIESKVIEKRNPPCNRD